MQLCKDIWHCKEVITIFMGARWAGGILTAQRSDDYNLKSPVGNGIRCCDLEAEPDP